VNKDFRNVLHGLRAGKKHIKLDVTSKMYFYNFRA